MSKGRSQRLQLEQKAIAALLSSRSISEAAKSVGVHPDTLQNWLKRDDFRKALHVERRRLMDRAVTRLAGLVEHSLLVVEAGLFGNVTRDQLAAARLVLDNMNRMFGKDGTATYTERLATPLAVTESELTAHDAGRDHPQSPISEGDR